jgi:cytochrome c553
MAPRRCLVVVLMALVGPANADARRGEKPAQLCLLCHRPDSAVPAPLLEAQPARYLVRQIDAYRAGKRSEPGMRANVANLTAREITDIADYFASAPLKRHGASIDEAKARTGERRVAELGCETCHRPGLAGGGDIPRLAGQLPSYLERQLEGFIAGDPRHPATRWPAAGSEVAAVVHYLASLRQ